MARRPLSQSPRTKSTVNEATRPGGRHLPPDDTPTIDNPPKGSLWEDQDDRGGRSGRSTIETGSLNDIEGIDPAIRYSVGRDVPIFNCHSSNFYRTFDKEIALRSLGDLATFVERK
jgi:hypothetical protein